MYRPPRVMHRVVLAATLAAPYCMLAGAQESQAVRDAVADALRIGARQCEHALIMGKINVSQPGTPERTKAEAALAAIVERAQRESKRDDDYRARRDRLSPAEQGVVESAYRNVIGNCGKR